MNGFRLRAHVCAVAVVLPLMLARSAQAATIDCGAGDVDCLIAGINQANVNPQQKMTIRLTSGTYALTNIDNNTSGPNGLPSIVGTVTIDGGADGAILTRASGAQKFRFLHVQPSGHLTLNAVSLIGGDATFFDGSFDPLEQSGGALLNDRGVMTISNSVFDSNRAEDGAAVFTNQGTTTIYDSTFTANSGGGGGAVSNNGGVVDITRTVIELTRGDIAGGLWTRDGAIRIAESRFNHNVAAHGVGGLRVSGGTASINDTTFSGNGGDSTGALLVEGSAHVVVRDSAFIDNPGFGSGASIDNFGTIDVINTTLKFVRTPVEGPLVANRGRMTLINSTLTEDGGGTGGIIIIGSADTILENTIVFSLDPSVLDCFGAMTSLGNNLIGDPSSCLITLQPSDLVGDAGLGDLIDDATPGNAHFPLLSTSQAIDAANQAACPQKDQIGQPRRPRCDIGAVEFRRATGAPTTPR